MISQIRRISAQHWKLTRDAQQNKLPNSGIVQNLELLKVPGNHRRVDSGRVLKPEGVTDIIDAHPDTNNGVLSRPGRIVGLGRQVVAEDLDLVDKGDDRRIIRLHNISIDRGASVREVVGVRQRGVELGHHEANPVEAA